MKHLPLALHRHAPLLISLLTAGSAFAFDATRPPSGGEGSSYKNNLYAAARTADSLVAEINSEISYIQSGGDQGGPDGDCSFCEGPRDVLENDNVVVQHLLIFADRAQEIGRLAREAAQQPPTGGGGPAQEACNLSRRTMNAIPDARATIYWAARGVARPSTFDGTERATSRIISLLPNCF